MTRPNDLWSFPAAEPGSSQLLTETLRGPHVRGVPGVCRMWKGADDDRDAHHRPRHNRNDSIPSVPARLPHLKSPDAATAAARTPSQSPAIISTHRFPASIFSHYLSQGGKPWPLFITTSDALPASGSRPIHAAAPRGKRAKAADASTAASPASPQADSPLRCPPRRTAQPMPTRAAPAILEVLRDGDIRPSSRRRPRRRPAGPPPDRNRPLRHRRGCRWRHRPGPGGRTGPGRLPGRARRRTPGLGTRPGLPGAMRAVPGAVPGADGRIAPPDGNRCRDAVCPYRTVVR